MNRGALHLHRRTLRAEVAGQNVKLVIREGAHVLRTPWPPRIASINPLPSASRCLNPVRSKSGINMQRNSGCGDHGAVLRLRVAAFKIPAARFSKKRLLDDGDSRRTSASSDVRMNCSGS